MDFGGKCIIFVLAKRREPIDTGVSPLFLAKIGVKKVVLHYELVISTLRRKIFLGVCEKFFRNVGLCGRNSEVFLGVEIIKEVKVFSSKKL